MELRHYDTVDDLREDYPDFTVGGRDPGPYHAHMRADNEFGVQGHLRVSSTLDGLAKLMDEQREKVAARLAAAHPGSRVAVLGRGEYRATDAAGDELARGTEVNLRALLPFAGL